MFNVTIWVYHVRTVGLRFDRWPWTRSHWVYVSRVSIILRAWAIHGFVWGFFRVQVCVERPGSSRASALKLGHPRISMGVMKPLKVYHGFALTASVVALRTRDKERRLDKVVFHIAGSYTHSEGVVCNADPHSFCRSHLSRVPLSPKYAHACCHQSSQFESWSRRYRVSSIFTERIVEISFRDHRCVCMLLSSWNGPKA